MTLNKISVSKRWEMVPEGRSESYQGREKKKYRIHLNILCIKHEAMFNLQVMKVS